VVLTELFFEKLSIYEIIVAEVKGKLWSLR